MWEIDPTAQRRRALAESLLQIVSARDSGDSADRPLDDLRDISTWLEGFWSALHRATESEFRDNVALEQSVLELSRLSSGLATVEPRRPFARAVSSAQAMSDSCVAMVRHYLAALVSPTPLQAQNEATNAQRALDGLAAQTGDLAVWLRRQEGVSNSDSVQESLGFLVADCLEATGTTSLLDLARHFQAHLATFADVEPGPDAAIAYALNSAFADLFLSPEGFEQKVRRGADLLLGAGGNVERMLKDPVFQADAQRLRVELFDSGVACQSAIANAAHPRQAMRAVVELHAALVESTGMVIALPYLTAVGQKEAPYASLRRGNATEHLQKAQAHPKIADLLTGLDAHVRTAQSHRAIEYLADELRTDLKSGEQRYLNEDLIDSTFMAVESALAGLMAILLVSSAREWMLPDDAGLDALGFTPTQVADFLLTSFGFNHDGVQLTDGTLEVGVPSIVGFTVAVGALLPSMPPESISTICVTTEHDGVWTCPIEPYKAFAEANEDFNKQVALMRVQSSWRSEERTWLAPEVLAKWTATQITELLELDFRERSRRLLLLRRLAEETGAQDVVGLVRGYVRLVRLQVDGYETGEPERQVLRNVIAWSTSDVDFELI